MLIACYHFPPDAAVGGLRPARFARALPTFGWQPMVLTAGADHRGPLDVERTSGLDDLTIARTADLRGPRWAYLQVKRRLGRTARAESGSVPADRDQGEGLGRAIRRHLVSLLMFIPDDKKMWAVRSAIKAVFLVRRKSIACVITSGPPASVHLVGLLAVAVTNVKWVADFRDPWVESLTARPPHARSRLSDAIERWMEALVVRRANRVLTTTRPLKNALERRYGRASGGKIVCIPNGVETAMFDELPEDKYPTFTISYTGTLYEGRTPEPLFRAVRLLLDCGRIEERGIAVKLVGRCESIDGRPTAELVERYDLTRVVEFLDVLPQSEAIRIMKKSHLLLLLAPAVQQLTVPAKLYEYLASGTDVLAITDDGAAADLLREADAGRCFAPTEVDDIAAYVAELASRSTPPCRSGGEWRDRFGSRRLTARLAAELAAVCDPAASGARQ